MKVLILSGIPGSGKSTAAAGEAGAVVCSADDYFTNASGEYHFDPRKLSDAHAACLRKFLRAVLSEEELIIVDNTNTTAIEIAPYVAIAAAHGAEVEVRTYRCDPEVGAKRNRHGVPLEACRAMEERLAARKLPEFWKVKEVFIKPSWLDRWTYVDRHN